MRIHIFTKIVIYLFIIFPLFTSLADELTSNQDEIEYYLSNQSEERTKRKFFLTIGLPDGVQKISTLSFGYNINKIYSIGVSRNFYNQYDRDRATDDGVLAGNQKWRYFILDYSQLTTIQNYGNIKGAPDLGFNLFLHYYPFAKKKELPIYIPLYLGRSIKSKVIFNSNNIMYNPNGESPILYMDANYLPSNYAGIGLGLKIDILGLNLGMEFGYIKMFSPGLEYNIRPSILNRVNLEFNEYYIYNELIKKAYSAPEEIKLNYGILVGISF